MTLGIAKGPESGAALGLVTGLAVGVESSVLLITVIAVAILLAFWRGNGLASLGDGLDFTSSAFQRVLYGTDIAKIGMLFVTPMVLAMDSFGPTTDDAGGILEMSGVPRKG